MSHKSKLSVVATLHWNEKVKVLPKTLGYNPQTSNLRLSRYILTVKVNLVSIVGTTQKGRKLFHLSPKEQILSICSRLSQCCAKFT